MTRAPTHDAHQLARDWAQKVRAGGTRTWADWVAGHSIEELPADPGSVRLGGPGMPGAAALEVVRRLAASPHAARVEHFSALADRVLSRSGPGRGLGELPLGLPGAGGPGFGPRAVDPGEVPLEELVRVAVGTLADLVLGLGPGSSPRPPRRRPLSRQFRLAGAPGHVAVVRSALAAQGRVEGGRRPRVLLLAAPVGEALHQVWAARVARGAQVTWPAFVTRWAARDRLPPALDVPALAQGWARRVGAESVDVLVAPDPAIARQRAAEWLGAGVPPGVGRPALAWSPAATDVARRLNKVLAIRLEPGPHRELLATTVADLLPAVGAEHLRVPDAHRDWAREGARGLAEWLGRAGYPVLGDPTWLVDPPGGAESAGGAVPRPRRGAVLEATLTACLRAAAETETRGLPLAPDRKASSR